MAVDMFLKIDDIKGESKDRDHKDWIEVLSFSWGVSNSQEVTRTGGGGAGKVQVQDISITKFLDKSSTTLLQSCFTGRHLKMAVLRLVRAGERQHKFLEIKLSDVIVSSLSTGGSGGEDRLTENISLDFGSIQETYYAQDEKGSVGAPDTVSYNPKLSR